jgi:protein kinase-like protein
MPTIQDPAAVRIGQTLSGKWRLERLIGVGGMAAVYEASHRNGANAAIKILHPEFARRADTRSRFLREAYIANKAGKGAVPVLDDDVADDGAPYLVMELLRGEAVDERAARLGGKLPLKEVLWIARETLLTLEHAHQAGIIHRDLKPENLFWTTESQLRVLDFGVARLRDVTTTETEHTKTGFVVGTPRFMAPEQAIGSTTNIDARTDLWSVGAIMFTTLTGRDVHEGGGNPVVVAATRRARSLGSLDAAIPAGVVRVVDRALTFERDARYPDARTMREHVEALLGDDVAEDSTMPAARMPDPSFSAGEDATLPHAAESRARVGFATQMSDVDTAALRELFDTLAKAVAAHIGRGAGSPQSIRTLDVAYRRAKLALVDAHIGLFWNVQPEGFFARDNELLWTPEPPLPPSAERMFRGGVRMLGLLPGLTKPEFEVVARMLACDPSPFTDFPTLLQSSGLEHVVYRLEALSPATPGLDTLTLEPSSSRAVPVGAILAMLSESDDPAIRATLLSRLERRADGYEAEIARLLDGAGVDLAIGLLRVLAILDSDAAREAAVVATTSAHAVVRVFALSTRGGGADDLEQEVRSVLEGPRADERRDLLVQLDRYKIKAALPALAARISSRAFDSLPADERRLALGALGGLDPARAEAVAVELLSGSGSATRDERTRELAAETLGRFGTSSEARDALEAAKTRGQAGDAVQAALEVALAAMTARAATPPAPRRPSGRSKRRPSEPPSSRRSRSSKKGGG